MPIQRIQLRRDTSSNWTSINPTLLSGEVGVETNTGKIKIGNGTSLWNSLSYFTGGSLSYNDLTNLPSIPSKTSDLTNDSGFITSADVPTDISELTDTEGLLENNDNGNFTFSANTLSLSTNDDLVIQSQGEGGTILRSFETGYSQLEWTGTHDDGIYLWVDSEGIHLENIVGQQSTFDNTGKFSFPGHIEVEGVTSTGATGTGNLVFSDGPTFTGTVSGISKSMVGLGNVDNTSDADKPISDDTQDALDLKANIESPTFTGTVTTDLLTAEGETVLSNTTINGTFTLNGETQYIVSENAVYTDNLLEIHAPDGGVGETWSTNDGKDIGIRMHYYNGVTDKNAALFLDNGTWRLKWVVDGTETSGQISHTALGDIEAATFHGNLVGNVTGDVTGNVTGNAGTVTNGVYTTGSYSNPTWITSIAGSKVTGNISGNANTATSLQTARTINGVSFDGTANITVTAAAGTLTGTTLASNVVSSSLTSVGTLTNLAVTNTITGSVSGNAGTATKLQTARTINGVSFDGTADITISAAGNNSGQVVFSGVISPTVLSATTHNYNPTGLSTCNVLRISASTNISVTGLQAPSPAVNQVIYVINVGSGNINCVRSNPGSLAANQWLNNNDIMLNPNECMIIMYDAISAGWRTLGHQI